MKTKHMQLIIAIMILLTPLACRASMVLCDNVAIKMISVQGPRDDGHPFANHLVLSFKDANGNSVNCAGKLYGIISNSQPAYASMLSAAITAATTGKLMRVYVNTNSSTSISNQLSLINILY